MAVQCISTIKIGIIDAEHTRNDGFRYSTARTIASNAQFVTGFSSRYNGTGVNLGGSVWLYNGVSTVNIGLTDTEHTDVDNGARDSRIYELNNSGQVTGSSKYFNNIGINLGNSAWLYNGTRTVKIGLIDPDHLGAGGRRDSTAIALNESGQVAGTSFMYRGSSSQNPQGSTAWFYDGNNTIPIGLRDGKHTNSKGFRSGNVVALNESGHVAGWSRFSVGINTWLYDGTRTIEIGLVDADHTRLSNGNQHSKIEFLNELQVAGSSLRFASNIEDAITDPSSMFQHNDGQTAWLYDLTLDQTIAIELSVSPSGHAYSSIQYLGDDGLALGFYKFFDGRNPVGENRAFAFSVEDGAFDLGKLLDSGLDTAGWSSLASAYSANDSGLIVGDGLLNDAISGQTAFLLKPVSAVPLPASVWMFVSGFLGLISVARSKQAA